MTEPICFKAYDIRGGIGVNIGDGRAYHIGRAVAQHLDAKFIVIGGDTGETSLNFIPAALKAFLRAWQKSGNHLAKQSCKRSDNGALWAGEVRLFRREKKEDLRRI